jgi:CheY-like chemotaxis protein
MGIEPEMLPRVFDLFTQADRSLERSRGGLGIGLSVVRSLVELHGGTVAVRSDGKEHGSEFTVELPISAAARTGSVSGSLVQSQSSSAGVMGGSPSSASAVTSSMTRSPRVAPATDGPCGRTRVLVVDDNADIAESTALILQLAGYTVKKALSGQEALEMASSFDPAVILLDIGMPGLDGYAVARRLRGEANMKDAVLIAVTGYGTSADRSRARAAGFDRHLVKPVDPAALQHLLTDLAVETH